MALVEGAKLVAFLNGAFMQYVTSISFVTESGLVPMETITEGLSGFTEGTGNCQIEIGLVMPSTGQEHQYQQICANSETCTIQVGAGAESYAAQGKIITNSWQQTVNGGTEGSFTWQGPKKPIE